MSIKSRKITELIDMLPEKEQKLAYEFIKRMILAWDNDFTKLTPDERKELEISDIDIENEDFVEHDQIDW